MRNPIIKLAFGDGFCSTNGDVWMVYEWVYQIIYVGVMMNHTPGIHSTYLFILSLYIVDYHAGFSWKTPDQPVYERTTKGLAHL